MSNTRSDHQADLAAEKAAQDKLIQEKRRIEEEEFRRFCWERIAGAKPRYLLVDDKLPDLPEASASLSSTAPLPAKLKNGVYADLNLKVGEDYFKFTVEDNAITPLFSFTSRNLTKEQKQQCYEANIRAFTVGLGARDLVLSFPHAKSPDKINLEIVMGYLDAAEKENAAIQLGGDVMQRLSGIDPTNAKEVAMRNAILKKVHDLQAKDPELYRREKEALSKLNGQELQQTATHIEQSKNKLQTALPIRNADDIKKEMKTLSTAVNKANATLKKMDDDLNGATSLSSSVYETYKRSLDAIQPTMTGVDAFMEKSTGALKREIDAMGAGENATAGKALLEDYASLVQKRDELNKKLEIELMKSPDDKVSAHLTRLDDKVDRQFNDVIGVIDGNNTQNTTMPADQYEKELKRMMSSLAEIEVSTNKINQSLTEQSVTPVVKDAQARLTDKRDTVMAALTTMNAYQPKVAGYPEKVKELHKKATEMITQVKQQMDHVVDRVDQELNQRRRATP